MLVGQDIFLFSTVSKVALWPTLPPIQQRQVFLSRGQIVGGVIKTTDRQQASRTVAKSFLAAMCKHVRFNWKVSVGNIMEPRTML